jgi:undecaprenyl-diphosphatase
MLWEALVLGCIQGLTEFLPVSSSAHLTLIPQLFHWQTPWLNSLSFDVALHLGTLLALLLYFGKELGTLALAWLRKGLTGQALQDPDSKLAWWIILGTIPAVVLGVPFEKKAEIWFRAPLAVAIAVMAAGVLMGLAEYFSRKQKTLKELTLGQTLAIGCAQALALIPGVSRSGITLTASLFAGFKREEAARFSFLLAIPVTAGACVLKFKDLLKLTSSAEIAATAAGIVTSAVVGWLCIHFLLAYLRKSSLYIFVAYRLLLGAVVVVWSLSQ